MYTCFMISVCQRIVEEIDREIDKIAPSKKVDVGSYRLDGQGEMKRSSVSNYTIYFVQLVLMVSNNWA